MLRSVWLHCTKVNFFNRKEYCWPIYWNSWSLRWVLSFLLFLASFWRFVCIALALNYQINWRLDLFLIEIKYIDLNIECIKLSFKGIKVAIDEVRHLLINHVFWVHYVEDLVNGTDFLVVLGTCDFIGVDLVVYLCWTNVL